MHMKWREGRVTLILPTETVARIPVVHAWSPSTLASGALC
jgi:hypothetical protein